MQLRPLVIGATLALAGSAFIGGAASAQDMMEVAHPAHIHAGTCPTPGDVVARLTDVTPSMAGPAMGQATAIPVGVSVTSVPLALADLETMEPHAIVVHASADDMGTYLLCGDIGGEVMAEGVLPIGLGAVGESGSTGIAVLVDAGDGTTNVTLYVTHASAPMGGEMEQPMEASPSPAM